MPPALPLNPLLPASRFAQPPDVVETAHRRSTAFGLRAHETADVRPASSHELHELRQRNQSLFLHVRPVMETLHQQIADTRSMVVLTNSSGTILHALGDDDFLARADRVALRPGVTWSEQSKGTNAIGTALVEGLPMQIHAQEHFLQANHFLTCSCAPILDPAGRTIGALDVSGDHQTQSKHTMALVRMSAQMVENHLFAVSFEHDVRVRFHARHEFLGTLVEGLAAFTPDGRFLSANRSGQFQFGMPLAALQAHTFSSLFGMEMPALLDHLRHRPAEPVTLRLPSGVAVMARADFQLARPVLFASDAQAPATARPARAPSPAAGGGLSSLRYLDTGDPQLARAIERVRKVLGRDIATLILGDTGTGKELLARAIHQDSPRRGGPFVAVNCASIPETLIESELFGYEDGAFTGARRRGSVGRVVQAHGGTLFLDEIGDMPLALQARLLRVLQDRSVSPLGGARQVEVDVALVCATHRDLRAMIAAGSFREDLYYRLNGLVVRLPPLRERTDLDAVVTRLLAAEARTGGTALALSQEVRALFARYAWPGNFRQLANVLRTAALMAEGAAEIGVDHLPDDFLEDVRLSVQAPTAGAAQHDAAAPSATRQAGAGPLRLGDITARVLDDALASHRGNVSAAARALGVSRNTVYRHLRR
ncbi:sigma-54-dependent Fis family transcriptional regulator [Xylophilus sp.]|uniref:sigma-54-dependent Fis family transcriptional regulator n=1 Tax=Xylophilus sp. TaxID=2653893 RepID=UPI0013B99430|nr:sigma-54-dependent Fis family transcriptional regulator [Xylophilus sp.]KAF1049542.1 MAG: Acetoin catabolism regulatory protein [Xylophilus sp.]